MKGDILRARMNRRRIGTACAGALAAALAVPVAAQPASESAWAPWLGCWTLQTEQVSGGDAASARGATRPDGIRVCVAPGATLDAVTLTTVVDDTPAFSQSIVADGAAHPLSEAGCEGQQRASWSSNRRLLFTSADLTCRDEAPRRVSQLALLTAGGVWVDVQSVIVDGRESVRTRRYRPAAGHPDAARLSPGSALTLDDIREASAAVSPRVVEAAMVETKASFDLNARKLVALDDAGVPDSVIDLAVALSYPDRFTVDRASSAIGTLSEPSGWTGPMDWTFGDPYLWGYYAPYAFSYLGYGQSWLQPGYGWVIIDPSPGVAQPPGGEHGRVVNGVGYTRVRPREPAAVRGPMNSPASEGPTVTGASTSAPSSGGVSGQGYSSGGAGSTGRTAQPRPPGPGSR